MMNSFVSAASSCACASPVRACAFGGRIGSISESSCWSETPGFAATRDLVEPPFLLEEPLRRREVEAGERRAADREVGAELDDPGDPEALDGPFHLDADLVADPEVLLVRDAGVDDDLVRAGPGARRRA